MGGQASRSVLSATLNLSKESLQQYLKKFDADEVEVLKKVYKSLALRSETPGASLRLRPSFLPLCSKAAEPPLVEKEREKSSPCLRANLFW